ncbi:hypothetical protein K469DRAFT_130317 [Zopfia rhizophila CBS 207.26]|uniref:Uncharacterized protein n=1 Tax=Zopfia rhizophila CBS 207.26 TaxID=1314779 RepID=A0A6A6EUB2_9PEZI|nr:hypothetical protein K469DRAFT_130317 [Zopfia rhizophila CBS 207.26]
MENFKKLRPITVFALLWYPAYILYIVGALLGTLAVQIHQSVKGRKKTERCCQQISMHWLVYLILWRYTCHTERTDNVQNFCLIPQYRLHRRYRQSFASMRVSDGRQLGGSLNG